MNNESIRKIADHYGFPEQSRQLAEECSELIVAVNKYYRKCESTSVLTPNNALDLQYCISNITEEIADVSIMIEQMKYLLNIFDDNIEQIIEQKLNRQLERIEKNE